MSASSFTDEENKLMNSSSFASLEQDIATEHFLEALSGREEPPQGQERANDQFFDTFSDGEIDFFDANNANNGVTSMQLAPILGDDTLKLGFGTQETIQSSDTEDPPSEEWLHCLNVEKEPDELPDESDKICKVFASEDKNLAQSNETQEQQQSECPHPMDSADDRQDTSNASDSDDENAKLVLTPLEPRKRTRGEHVKERKEVSEHARKGQKGWAASLEVVEQRYDEHKPALYNPEFAWQLRAAKNVKSQRRCVLLLLQLLTIERIIEPRGFNRSADSLGWEGFKVLEPEHFQREISNIFPSNVKATVVGTFRKAGLIAQGGEWDKAWAGRVSFVRRNQV